MNTILTRECITLDSLPIVSENPDAALRDMGEGIACLQFRSKGNSITPDVKSLLSECLERHLDGFDGMIIANQAKNFSVGANLHVMKRNLDLRDYVAFEANVSYFQRLNLRLKYFPKPIVAAPYRHSLGGGLEIAMHCHGRVVLADCFMGLVEIGVGLIPGGGGTKECAMLISEAPAAARTDTVMTVFEKLLLRRVSRDATGARSLFYLKKDDIAVHDSDDLIPMAKARCLELARGGVAVKVPHPALLSGAADYGRMMDWAGDLLSQGAISPYDLEVGKRIATVLSGGSGKDDEAYTEEELLALERECFLDLVRQQGTYERISHFVENSELLRN